MRKLIVILALTLTACGGVESPTFPETWDIEGEQRLDTATFIDVVVEQAPCEMVRHGRGVLKYATTEYIQCGEVDSAEGCAWRDPTPHVELSTTANDYALIHELGHIAFWACGIDTHDHPTRFMAWISWTHMAYESRMYLGR